LLARVVGMKLKPPLEFASTDVPEHRRSAEEDTMLEEARIDRWIAAMEAGEPAPSVPITGEWSTVQEVAARHRCSAKTIRARIHDGSLKAVDQAPKGAGARQARYRIHREAEEVWIRSKGEKGRATAARRAKAGSTFRELVQK
jgi:hypothetical protein